ncbi:endopeptidase La [bacterium]|nr:endopeptidase La [bacterium]
MERIKDRFALTASVAGIEEEPDFIPLMTSDDEAEMKQGDLPEELPILPLRNTVLFPGVVIPITAGRDKSIKLLQDAHKKKLLIGIVAQRDLEVEDPQPDDLFPVGTVARILRMFRMPDGNTTVILQGYKRFRMGDIVSESPYLKAKVAWLEEKKPKRESPQFKALIDSIKDLAIRIIQESPHIPTEAAMAVRSIDSNAILVNFISANMNLEVAQKQELLEETELSKRAQNVLRHLTSELQMLEMKNEIQTKVKTEFDQQQREYFLHQQMKTIQEELGGSSIEMEIEELRARGHAKKWTPESSKTFDKELLKLQRINPQAPEYSVQRNYLELMLDLPWGEYSKDRFDLKRARKILDRDHFGLDKVKDRLIEHLAVLKLRGDMRSPILCLYGPPGVGKTSLGKSVAEALGRKYVRMALGGLRDEAEIRGHRKTYIGAMPGRILQLLKKAGTSNPVFVLDEIDKLGYGNMGDPSSAMLEVLDPEQNKEFYDNFLEMGYDLSKVLFIATANNLSSIQPALRDRMEIIELNGYTVEEKREIAKRHLVPKQLEENGLKKDDLKLSNGVLEMLIESYTQESGVRGLEKAIAKVARKTVQKVASGEPYSVSPDIEEIRKMIGNERRDRERYQDNSVAGVVTGLAWTPVGGEILFIESSLSPGDGKVSITGNLGDVMKESATIAMAYLKSNASDYGIPPEAFKRWDVHIHVPEGATPKDGPSAGVTMLTALASLFTQRKVRSHLAMTGEITLRGRVLPVGGIKEKILAAKRAGIQQLLLCEENRKDVEDIGAEYLKGLEIQFVRGMRELTDLALLEERVAHPKTI